MKVAVVGHTGRVGLEIVNLLKNSKHEFTAGWGRQGQEMFMGDGGDSSVWNPRNIDVVIDFSMPENFKSVVQWCQTNKKPLVSGVTGLGEIKIEKLKEILGKDFNAHAPIFWASNMSIGIALLKQFIELSKIFNPNKVSISETHHIHKKDSPSGTAITLASKAKQAFGLSHDIPIEAIRTEEVFGIHNVRIESDDEVIQLYHEAMNRKVFASGSIKVAEWLVSKSEPRLYFMEEYILDVKNYVKKS